MTDETPQKQNIIELFFLGSYAIIYITAISYSVFYIVQDLNRFTAISLILFSAIIFLISEMLRINKFQRELNPKRLYALQNVADFYRALVHELKIPNKIPVTKVLSSIVLANMIMEQLNKWIGNTTVTNLSNSGFLSSEFDSGIILSYSFILFYIFFYVFVGLVPFIPKAIIARKYPQNKSVKILLLSIVTTLAAMLFVIGSLLAALYSHLWFTENYENFLWLNPILFILGPFYIVLINELFITPIMLNDIFLKPWTSEKTT